MRAPRRGRRYAAARTALLAAAALAAGCGGGDDGPELTVDQVIDRAVDATAAEDTFRFRLEVENPPRSGIGLNLELAEGEVAVPDRLRADVAGTFAGIPLESQLVAVGDDEWLRNPFGDGFRRIDLGVSPLDFFDPDAGVLAVLENAEDVRLEERDDEYAITGDVAAETVDGFLGVDADERQLDVEVLVDRETFRLRRVAVIGPANEAEPADVRRVVELSDYGADVEITPPG